MSKRSRTIVVAGLGARFPGCASAAALASRLRRGQQAAGALPCRPGVSARDALEEHLAESMREALAVPFARDFLAWRPNPKRALAVINAGDEVDLFSVIDGAGIHPDAVVSARALPSLGAAFDFGRGLLTSGDVEAVLLIAGSALAEPPPPAPSFSIALERSGQTPPPSEGAAALLLARDDGSALARARFVATTPCLEPGARGIESAFQRALAAAGWPTASLGLFGLVGRRSTAVAEGTAVARLFKTGPRETALMAVSANVGDAGAAAGLGALVAAVACLERAMLPPLCGWTAAGPAMLREAEALYVPGDSRYWFARPDAPIRRAAILFEERNSSLALATLESGSAMAPIAVTVADDGAPLLFPLAGIDREALEAGLAALTADLRSAASLPTLSRKCMKAAMAAADAPLALAVVAANPKDLEREIGFMHRALEKAQATGKTVRTPNGSVFAPAPLGGGRNKVAFVYPGNGTAYPGLGRDILLSVAKGVATVDAHLDRRLAQLLCAELTYPRKIERVSEADLASLAAKLAADPVSLPLIGIAFGVAHSYILRAGLGINPDAAFGYSVGELAMRIALGQAKDWAGLERKLHAPCLVSGLSGPMTTVREFWSRKNFQPRGALWACHIVKASAQEVRAAIADMPNVFLMAINAPDETAISGAPEACLALVARLGAPSMPIDLNVAIHSPPATLEQAALYEICDSPIEPVTGIDFYSAADARPVAQTREAVAATTARALQTTIDFPRLVESIYADGARIFIETGVRNNCTNWIGAILGERPHVAVAMDVKGMPSDVAWIRAVAVLFANRLPIDFTEFSEINMDHVRAPTRLLHVMEQG